MKIYSKMSGMSSHWISHTWKCMLTLRLCSLVPQCCVWMSHEFEWGRVHRCVHNSYCTILVFVPCKRMITFQSHFSPQACMVTLTFHTHSWQSICDMIKIVNPRMSFATKYGWNGILSVFLLGPNGLFDPVWYCCNCKWY